MSSSDPARAKRKAPYFRLFGCIVTITLSGAIAVAIASQWLGEASYEARSGVWNSRVRDRLPPGATDITVHMDVNGHFARYRVSGTEFHAFLDALWDAKRGSSSHQRDEMSGGGEPPNEERFARRFERFGWEPLGNAIQYHSPSKSSGAMTTYYYDRDAGMAYHDTGYW